MEFTSSVFSIISSSTFSLSFTLIKSDIIPVAVVATDDEKIAECCRGFGADVIMTAESCRNGTKSVNREF